MACGMYFYKPNSLLLLHYNIQRVYNIITQPQQLIFEIISLKTLTLHTNTNRNIKTEMMHKQA